MPLRKITLPTPNTVAASSTSLVTCPIGRNYRYRAIHLRIGTLATGGGAVTALPAGLTTGTPYVNDIRLKVNGRVQRLHTASQMNRLNAINGSPFAAQTWGTSAASKYYGQTLTIWFSEPWRKSLGQQNALALPSWLVNSLEVEVDFGALPSNGSAFVMSAFAEVDSDDADLIHKDGVVISKVFRHSITGGTAANSAVDVTWLDRRDLYTTILADLGNTMNTASAGAANGITVATAGEFSAKLKVTANGNDVIDLPKGIAANIHSGSGMNPSLFDLEAVLDSNDDIRSGLSGNGLSDLRVRIDVGGDTAASSGWTLLTERTGIVD